MPPVLQVRALGAAIDLTCPDWAEPALRGQWAQCVVADSERVAADQTLDLTGYDRADPHVLEYAAASQVTYAGIEHQRGRRLMLHASAVADPETSGAVALVAASGTGKSTAALRLGQAGAHYLTDETVALDADHLVLPYPKPLSRVIDPAVPSRKSQHGPAQLGLQTAPAPCPLRLLVLLHRDPDRLEPAQLEPVDPIEAIMTMIPHTSSLPALDRPLGHLVDLLSATGGAQQLTYREITEAIPLLLAALRAASPADLPVTLHDPPPGWRADPMTTASPAEHDPGALGPWRRGAFTQAVEHAGEAVVLIGTSPLRLNGLGLTIWHACAAPRTVDELVAVCVATHGDPGGDVRALVTDAARVLAAHHLLTTS